MTPTSAAAGEGAAALAGGGAVPRHVAIIMDGNGRWAKQRRLPRAAGHKAGAEAIRPTIEAAVRHGVEVLTLYAFSSENWRRSEDEVSELKGLMGYFLDRELARLTNEGARIRVIGDYRAFGPKLVAKIDHAIRSTADNSRITLVAALNYGARQEIANAAAKAAAEGQISTETISSHLETAGLPELDLLIRTSGEVRLSNFLLWQSAYAELLFTPVLWPDFDEACFDDALAQFSARQRRFGGR